MVQCTLQSSPWAQEEADPAELTSSPLQFLPKAPPPQATCSRISTAGSTSRHKRAIEEAGKAELQFQDQGECALKVSLDLSTLERCIHSPHTLTRIEVSSVIRDLFQASGTQQ